MSPSSPEPTLVTPEVLRGRPLPEPTGGKNARGSILVIGGSTETLGAVLLAAEAAMRAGAGKLQVATVASLAPFAATALPEALVRGLPETDGGAIAPDAADTVRDLAEAADAVLIGPGMADKEATQAFGERLLPHPAEIADGRHTDEEAIEADPAAATLDLAGRTRALVGLGGATAWIATD